MKQTGTTPRQALLAVHIEPDIAAFTSENALKPQPWLGFEKALPAIAAMREELDQPLHVEWLLRMDPQIAGLHGRADWAVTTYREQLETIQTQETDSLGLHVHTMRYDEQHQNWLTDFEDQDYVKECIRVGVETYEASFGKIPETIAMGNNWMSQSVLEYIRSQGVLLDLSTVSGRASVPTNAKLLTRGDTADYSLLPALPYQPSAENYQQPDSQADHDFWMLPMSSLPQKAFYSLKEKLASLLSAESRQRGNQLRKFQLRHGAGSIAQLVNNQLTQSEAPYIALECRSNLFNSEAATGQLKQVISYLQQQQFSITAARDLVAHRQVKTPSLNNA